MHRDVKAVILPPGRRLCQVLEAAINGGGPAICPLPPGLPPAALRSLLAALRPACVETSAGTEPYDAPAGLTGTVPVDVSTAVLIATSGSTGAPKIVELSADALLSSALASIKRLGAEHGRWLCCLPPSHIGGLQVLVRSLIIGTEPVIHERFDMAAIVESGAAHVSLVPTQVRRLLKARVDLSIFQTILLGGAAASDGLLDECRAAGGRVVRTYGMSETSGGCVYDRVPLDDVSVDVDEAGLIRISGPVLFDRYRLRPELTADVFDGRWLRTNDLGRLDNGLLRVLGRADDVINTGGEKVIPVEVEQVLSRHPSVKDVVVVGRPDAEWGERVTAVIVPADPATPPALASLRAHVCESLPAYAAPHEISLVEAIPLLPSGKPDRSAAAGL